MSEEIGYCTSCRGEGVIHTGIDEAPVTECSRCDGTGELPVAAPLPAAPAPTEQGGELPPLPTHSLASMLEEYASNPHYTWAEYAKAMKEASDALHAVTKWAEARAATPQAPAKGTLLVTLDSALAAIEHLSQSNSSGREVDALRMLVDVTPPAPTPAAAEGQAEEEISCDQCIELSEELQKEWMRKAIAETRTAASLFDAGGFRAGMETACDEIATRMALDGDTLPRQAAVQGEDAARLDWLEQRGNDGGLLLHAGNQDTGGHSGLGLINTGRTLRQAVDSARGVKAAKSAPATTEKEKS